MGGLFGHYLQYSKRFLNFNISGYTFFFGESTKLQSFFEYFVEKHIILIKTGGHFDKISLCSAGRVIVFIQSQFFFIIRIM